MSIDYRKRLVAIAKQRERVSDAQADLEDAKAAAKGAKDCLAIETANLYALLDEHPDQGDLFEGGDQ